MRDGVLVETGDDERPHLVGHNLKAYIGDLEARMRKAAGDLEFEEAGRLRDEIRRLEENDLGIPVQERRAPRPSGNATQGKPGTRRTGFGKTRASGAGRSARRSRLRRLMTAARQLMHASSTSDQRCCMSSSPRCCCRDVERRIAQPRGRAIGGRQCKAIVRHSATKRSSSCGEIRKRDQTRVR